MNYEEIRKIVDSKPETIEERLDWFRAMVELSKETHAKNSKDSQYVWVFKRHACPLPCPLCESKTNFYAAIPLDVEFKVHAYPERYACPRCGIRLEHIVPLAPTNGPGWHWDLHEEAKEQLLELWRKERRQ